MIGEVSREDEILSFKFKMFQACADSVVCFPFISYLFPIPRFVFPDIAFFASEQ